MEVDKNDAIFSLDVNYLVKQLTHIDTKYSWHLAEQMRYIDAWDRICMTYLIFDRPPCDVIWEEANENEWIDIGINKL